MSAEASREQLLDYIKKQKIKIKKLEIELNECKENTGEEIGELRAQLQHISASTPSKTVPDDASFASGWNSFAGFVTNVVSEVGGVAPGEEGGQPDVTVEQLRNLLAEKDGEIDSLKQQISSVESLSADRLNEKCIEVECHMEVIEALKAELSKAQSQARRSSLDAFAAGTAAVGAVPVEPVASVHTHSQADVDAAVERAVAAAVESAVAGSSADLALLQGKLQDAEALVAVKQAECETNKVKLVKFNAVVKAKMAEVETLRSQMAAAEATRVALEETHAEEKLAHTAVEARCQELQALSVTFESQVNAAKAECAAAAELAKTESERATASQQRTLDKLKELKRQLNEKGGEISILQATLTSEQSRAKGLAEQHEASAAELERMRAAQGRVSNASERLKKSKTATEEARAEYERALSELNLKLKQAQEEAALAREEREHQRRRVLELEGEAENMANMQREELEDMQREAGAARDVLTQAHKSALEAAEQEKTTLLERKEAAAGAHAVALQELRDASQAAIDALSAGKDAMIADMQQQHANALESAQAAAAANIAGASSADEVARYKAALDKAVGKLKSQKAQLDTEQEKLHESLAALKAKEKELAELHNAHNTCKESAEKRHHEHIELQTQHKSLEQQHRKELEDLQQKHSSLEEKLEQAKLDHDAHLMSRKHLEETLHAAQQEVIQMRQHMEQVRDSAAHVDASSTQLQDMQAQLDIQVKTLGTSLQEIVTLKQENTDLQTRADSQLAALQAEKETLSKSMATMVSELERESVGQAEKKDLALQRESQIAALQAEKESLAKELSDLVSSTAAQSLQLRDERNAVQLQLKTSVAEHENAINRISRETDERMVQWEEKHNDLHSAHKTTQQEHQAELTRLKREADKRVQEWEAKHNLLQAAQKSSLAEQEDIAAKLNADLALAQESTKSLPLLQAEKEALAQEIVTLNTAVEDGNTQRDVLRDKVQRLKVLLQRSKIITQEKNEELARLQERNNGGNNVRADKFEVLAMVEFASVGNSGGADADTATATATAAAAGAAPLTSWVLLFVDAPTEQPGAGLRWVEETIARAWETEGSVVLGEWPECLQMTHRRALKGAKVNLERELANAKQSLKEQEDAFAAYKVRAQAALKRLGAEEAAARERAANAAITKEQDEEEELLNLRTQRATLAERVQVLEVALSEEKALVELHKADAKAQLEQEVSRATADMQEALFITREESAAALSAQQEAMQKEQHDLQKQLNLFRLRIQELEHEADCTSSAASIAPAAAYANADNTAANASTDKSRPASVTASPVKTASAVSPAQQTPAPVSATASSPVPAVTQVSDAVASILSAATATNSQTSPSSSSSSAQFSTAGTSEDAASPNSLSPVQLSASASPALQQLSQTATPTPKGQGKALLYQRAEQEMKQKIDELREENTRTQAALRQSNEQRALGDEQLIVIKNSLREVEATLAREKEFFAQAGGDRALNVEYLANILKKFLLTEPSNMSERARLAPVLCQILHFQAKDIQMVESLWKEKPYMGPLGFGFLRG